jgi:glyoxylase-like metal-dependent hydrolase (beta-lactamase superfamily II)
VPHGAAARVDGGRAMSRTIPALLLAVLPVPAAFSQVDFSGAWDHPGLFGQEDFNDRGQGPEIGDYLGLPLNEAGMRKAETYSGSWLSVPEHQCTPHPAAYQLWGPNTLVVDTQFDAVRRVAEAIRLEGTFGIDRIVWMDGRPHPAPEALHTFEGFSTGHWEGDSLVVETTHMKAGWLRRNGTPTSERARMLEYFTRYDDYLLVTTLVDDPVYFAEPFVRTTEYLPTERPAPVLGDPFTRNDGPTFYKCFPAEETTAGKYYVPHYLPGENELLDEFSSKYSVPRWAMAVGAATMYPEFASLLERSGNSSVSAEPAVIPARDPAPDGIRSMYVKGQIWAIFGAGGNITVQIGDEGVLVVDTGTAEMAPEVREEIRRLAGDRPIRYVITTHFHDDHTGGNVVLANEPEQRAAILAHENVGLRLIESGAEAGTLIMDTFYGDSKEIYFNGEPIEIIHVPAAHTDGDSIVFFRGSDVISAGGVISTTSFPSFNVGQGGSANGLLAALNRILDITVAETRGQGGTIVVPGHGRLYDETDVAEYRDMLTIIRDRIQSAIDKGESLREVLRERPALDYSGIYDASGGPWTTEAFIEAVYQDLGGAR